MLNNRYRHPVILLMCCFLFLNTSCYRAWDGANYYAEEVREYEQKRESEPINDKYSFSVDEIYQNAVVLKVHYQPAYLISIGQEQITKRHFNGRSNTVVNFMWGTLAYGIATYLTGVIVDIFTKDSRNFGDTMLAGLPVMGTIASLEVLLLAYDYGVPQVAKGVRTETRYDESLSTRSLRSLTFISKQTGETWTTFSNKNNQITIPLSYFDRDFNGFRVAIGNSAYHRKHTFNSSDTDRLTSSYNAWKQSQSAPVNSQKYNPSQYTHKKIDPCSANGIMINALAEAGLAVTTDFVLKSIAEMMGIKQNSKPNSYSSEEGKGLSDEDFERLVVSINAIMEKENVPKAVFMNELENKIKNAIPGNAFVQEAIYAGAGRFWNCYSQSKR